MQKELYTIKVEENLESCVRTYTAYTVGSVIVGIDYFCKLKRQKDGKDITYKATGFMHYGQWAFSTPNGIIFTVPEEILAKFEEQGVKVFS